MLGEFLSSNKWALSKIALDAFSASSLAKICSRFSLAWTKKRGFFTKYSLTTLPKAKISQLHSNEEIEKANIEQTRINNQALIDKLANNIDSSLEREKLINSGAIYSQDMVDQVILEQNKDNEHAI